MEVVGAKPFGGSVVHGTAKVLGFFAPKARVAKNVDGDVVKLSDDTGLMNNTYDLGDKFGRASNNSFEKAETSSSLREIAKHTWRGQRQSNTAEYLRKKADTESRRQSHVKDVRDYHARVDGEPTYASW